MAITTTACFVLSQFCQILVLLVKEQREGPLSPVLLEWCYLSAWFWISRQRGENWDLSFKRGRTESKSALGYMKKTQRRSRAGTSLEAGETPEELAFLLPVLLEGSEQVWSQLYTLWSLSDVSPCGVITPLLLPGHFWAQAHSQTSLCCLHATVTQNWRVLSDSVRSVAFWCVERLQCVASHFVLPCSHSPA